VLLLALLLAAHPAFAQWPTRGGEGGRRVVVTSLAETGPGTLRGALEAEGPAVITFAVGGEIWLGNTLVINKPFLTIAGETAPEPGITLLGDRVRIRSHDVIFRHIRIRVGARAGGSNPGNRDALAVEGSPDGARPSHHVLVENCSFQWAVDETAQSWNKGGHDIVFRRCLIAEGLRHSIHPEGARSMGLVIGPRVRNILVQENLFISNAHKNIGLWGGSSALFLNNVIYNPGRGAVQFFPHATGEPLQAGVIGNVVVAGPDTESRLPLFPQGLNPGSRVYLRDNLEQGTRAFDITEVSEGEPRPFADASPVTFDGIEAFPAAETVERVTAQAGARPWRRDELDTRLLREFAERKGAIRDLPEDARLRP
jgi:hypothetical protein